MKDIMHYDYQTDLQTIMYHIKILISSLLPYKSN